MRAKPRRLAVKAVAGGALVAVDLGARHQVGLIGLDGRSLHHLAVDARMERHPGQQPLLRQGRVGHSHRHIAKPEPPQQGKRHKHDPQQNSQKYTPHMLCSSTGLYPRAFCGLPC